MRTSTPIHAGAPAEAYAVSGTDMVSNEQNAPVRSLTTGRSRTTPQERRQRHGRCSADSRGETGSSVHRHRPGRPQRLRSRAPSSCGARTLDLARRDDWLRGREPSPRRAGRRLRHALAQAHRHRRGRAHAGLSGGVNRFAAGIDAWAGTGTTVVAIRCCARWRAGAKGRLVPTC
ncbi:MAG: hypothetical protein RL701_7500 [Pseudomonadota bacterium]